MGGGQGGMGAAGGGAGAVGGGTGAMGGGGSAASDGGSAIPAAPVAGYRLVFSQDFTTMTSLSVNASSLGSATWIAHTPTNGDWFTFIDPMGNLNPFGIGDGKLTIRVAKRGYGDPNNWFGGFSGGLLSTVDQSGTGFAQQYGWFEAEMWCPPGRNTWPGFWLNDRMSLTQGGPGAEIDILEQYGNWGSPGAWDPDNYMATWHRWASPHTYDASAIHKPGLTSGYHRFAVDIEPDNIIWYYDRVEVWRAPTYAEARHELYVLVNLALGGGTYNNAAGDGYDWSLTTDPTDLKVRYIAVWASPNSPNY
jgi:hypothetical protein